MLALLVQVPVKSNDTVGLLVGAAAGVDGELVVVVPDEVPEPDELPEPVVVVLPEPELLLEPEPDELPEPVVVVPEVVVPDVLVPEPVVLDEPEAGGVVVPDVLVVEPDVAVEPEAVLFEPDAVPEPEVLTVVGLASAMLITCCFWSALKVMVCVWVV